MNDTRWRVALVVIARDEAPRIGRLLASVAPWVDEMVVLDTGSQDETVAVAAAQGARVGHFAWCDDFAAARNAALDLAGADWHLVLDADEWLVAGGPLLQQLRRTAPAFAGSIALVDHFDDGRPRSAHLRLTRVLPGPVRYAGRVHEQPQHRLPVRPLALQVGHDGYLPERLQAKRGRNRRLLARALEAAPDDAYLWFQSGKDAAVYDDHAEAEAAFARCAALLPAGGPRPAWWTDLVARRLFALKRLRRHAQGLDVAAGELQRCGASPDFFFALGDLLLDWAAEEPARAGELLPMIEQAWTRCLAIGEQPALAGAVAGRGSWLAAHNLALVYEGTGRGAAAAALRSRHRAPIGAN
ncbi:MAG: glycosyltransferase family 2 protein [Rubrivivax sp.]|nr:glycosyltransferase family 2 protein [Rubrivivax sp.]